jgi:hypothetical protein
VFEYLRQRGFRLRAVRADVLAVLCVPAALVAYAAYLRWLTGDALAFVHAQAGWGRQLRPPWAAFQRTLEFFADKPVLAFSGMHRLFDLAAVLFAAAMIVLACVGPLRLGRDRLVYPLTGALLLSLVILLPPVDREPLMSAPRLVMEIVVIVLVLARVPRLAVALAFVGVLLQGALFDHLLSGGWIA